MKLHAYQDAAVQHLHNQPRSGLFLDMGYTKPMRTCENPGCGREFKPGPGPKGRKQRFCSRACNLARFNADPEHQEAAGRIGGHRSRESRGYVKRENRHVHRTVAEVCLGRPLDPAEVVHHEDRNKGNNHPTNLVVFPTQADHARHHKLDHYGPCECPSIRLGGDAR